MVYYRLGAPQEEEGEDMNTKKTRLSRDNVRAKGDYDNENLSPCMGRSAQIGFDNSRHSRKESDKGIVWQRGILTGQCSPHTE